MKTVTIIDVAKRAGVSKSTVSQYLNGRYEYMGADTRERIKQAVEELGYRPNTIARSLKKKKTKTIGVILANILYSFSTKVIRAIEDVCNREGYQVIICNADDNPSKEKWYIEMLLAKQVDGIIAIPTKSNIDLYRKLKERNYPLVFVDRYIDGLDISTMMLHNEKAAKMCVDELTDNGYERIAMLTMEPISITPRFERIQGYKKALEDKGLKATEDYIASAPLKEMQTRLKELMALKQPPQAIIAINDLSFMQLLTFVKENKLEVPGDLAIIGIDDISFADLFDPPLTTIAQPAFDIGREAAAALIQKINNRYVMDADIRRFEPRLIRRASSTKS
ncbi:LacI family transcriptional regulator [Compostibacillus humi]|uniref:LacI family transcriptional regulator n=1 Tax=Compostibacillus humi TaxID=1245525 RepID=A0A8J3EJV0_9BACI|nr:substrate-binding domain-containing protein [Compostibacillus humi]GGH68084.1 LacI family transcriptional regulator [Compostibacillus humi]